LPKTTRSNGTVDLLELRPKGQVLAVYGTEKELPQLDTGDNGQYKVNDRVEPFRQLVTMSRVVYMKNVTYLLAQNQR
jgi:hypothetical protein